MPALLYFLNLPYSTFIFPSPYFHLFIISNPPHMYTFILLGSWPFVSLFSLDFPIPMCPYSSKLYIYVYLFLLSSYTFVFCSFNLKILILLLFLLVTYQRIFISLNPYAHTLLFSLDPIPYVLFFLAIIIYPQDWVLIFTWLDPNSCLLFEDLCIKFAF